MQYNKITTFLNKEDITLLFNQYPISINIRRASKNKNNNTEQEFFRWNISINRTLIPSSNTMLNSY